MCCCMSYAVVGVKLIFVVMSRLAACGLGSGVCRIAVHSLVWLVACVVALWTGPVMRLCVSVLRCRNGVALDRRGSLADCVCHRSPGALRAAARARGVICLKKCAIGILRLACVMYLFFGRLCGWAGFV